MFLNETSALDVVSLHLEDWKNASASSGRLHHRPAEITAATRLCTIHRSGAARAAGKVSKLNMKRMTPFYLLFVVLLALVLLGACRGGAVEEATPAADLTAAAPATTPEAAPTPTVASEPLRGQAIVESIQVVTLESFPVQVNVLARGELADGCTAIDDVISQRVDSEYRVVITTIRTPDAACTLAVVPFEETIPLDVAGLPAGNYLVSVNGISGSFTLDVDNVLAGEGGSETGTPAAGAAEAGSIAGRVWHDLCAVTGGAAAAGAEVPEGCVTDPDTTQFIANGTLDAGEPGIQGVTLTLFPGQCAAVIPAGALTTTSDSDGQYRFTGLTPGPYCVLLDTASEENSLALEEGVLTFPAADGAAAVELADGAGQTAVDFGYDFRFLPQPEVDLANCTNSSEFVEDLTVPDGTIFGPGATFTASWRLRNNGTCPWTTDYGVAYVSGDQLGVEPIVPLPHPVAPGQTVDASVEMVAPEQPGSYRSNWQVADANDQPFGIHGVLEDAFWVQIVVEEGAETPVTPLPNSATVGGVVWEDLCAINASGTPSGGCVETAEDSGFYRGNGTYDGNEAPLAGITVVLGEGSCPQDGLIPAANQAATTLTDEEGLYSFTGLAAGVYCVAINALSEDNVDLLIPGNWTYPAPGTGRLGVRLANGEQREGVDFGWDYQE
jgi:hypothetical protein